MSNASKMMIPNSNRPGYKETNVGWIPVAWDCVYASDLCNTITNGTTPQSRDGVIHSDSVPFIRVQNLSFDGRLEFDQDQIFISREVHESELARSKVFPGDVLTNLVGPPLGKVAQVTNIYPEWNINQAIAVFRVKEIFNSQFLSFFLQSFRAKWWLDSQSKKTSGQKNLTLETCRELPVPLPPVAEQIKIVRILSNGDTTIDRTRDLITAKKQQKKALMQQLLTGKKRLPGFNEKWVSRAIRSLYKTVSRPVVWDDEQVYPLLSVRRRSGGVFLREHLKGSNILTKNLFIAHTGDFLISKMQVLHGATGMVPPELDGCHISGSYIALRPHGKDSIDPKFFTCFSNSPEFRHLTYLCSYGVHIEKMTFNLDWFFESKVVIPPTVKEQRAIAEFLATADAEIKLLEEKLASLQLLKKGLMQQLLTGEIRVKT